MFKYLLISIVLVPVLWGVHAATLRGERRGMQALVAGWVVCGVLWLGLLYFLSHRWLA